MAEAPADARSWTGSTVRGRDGSKLGRLEHVHLAGEGGGPTWGVVRTGRLRRRRRFVPLANASQEDGTVGVPVDKRQVRSAPAPRGNELQPDTEKQLRRHYFSGGPAAGAGTATGVAATERRREQSGGAGMPRSRGAISGFLLVLLGAWGALVPFIGPYFDYAFGSDTAWDFSFDRLWLSILPGVATLLGGLTLLASANRASGGLGGWLALVGGIWFAIGPTMSMLWGSPGPAEPIGEPLGSTDLQVLEQLGYFYGLGALIIALAAFAIGRITVRSARDTTMTEGGTR